jgi:hypothetical protein
VEWAAQRLLPRSHLPIQPETRQAIHSPELVAEKLLEQRRERLLERLEKQLLELLAILLREQLVIQVEIQLAIQVQIHVRTQPSAQLMTHLPELRGELLRILQETRLMFQQIFKRTFRRVVRLRMP